MEKNDLPADVVDVDDLLTSPIRKQCGYFMMRKTESEVSKGTASAKYDVQHSAPSSGAQGEAITLASCAEDASSVASTSPSTQQTGSDTYTETETDLGISDVHPEAELIQNAMAAQSLAHKLDVEPPPYKLPRTRPVIIGHRGSIYDEPENTIPSFQRAIELGCDGIETDAFVVDCGTVIAFHADDAAGNIDEYCGEEGKNITEYTYEEVAEDLNLNADADVLFQCPKKKLERAQIPDMKDCLKLFKKHNMAVYMELKGPDTEAPTLNLVDELDMVDQVVFVSFEEERLEKIHQLRPDRNEDGTYKFRVALLFLRCPADFIERALRVKATEVQLRYDECTADRINAIHDAGMRSLAWCGGPKAMRNDGTIKYLDVFNECEDMYQCVLNSGVMAMCVNRPGLLVKMVEKYPPPNPLAEELVEAGAINVANDDINSTNMMVKGKFKQLMKEALKGVDVDAAVSPSM